MNFSDPAFIYIFLPLFLFGYFLISKSNRFILFFSILFYFIGEGKYLGIMICSILLNYWIGLFIHRKEKSSLGLLWLGITLNLTILTHYKYFNFFLNSFIDVSKYFDFNLQIGISQIHLPLGISFFTFQGLSYLIDVYHKNHEAEESFVDFATYISMFPQLIAGPIVRYSDIKIELHNRIITLDNVYKGIIRFTIGLAKKTLIADSLAIIVDNIYSLPLEHVTSYDAFIGSLAYMFQIYFDFSGYSDMAIGIGLIIGFKFPENFNSPYKGQSIQDFWRRWHITLSTWYRDYLYIPLGGSRVSTLKVYRNLFIVFFLCGLWHGASFTFILWGMYHGIFLILERFLKFDQLQIPVLIKRFYTLIVVYIGWIIFRSENVPQMFSFISKSFQVWNFSLEQIFQYSRFNYSVLLFATLLCFITKSQFEKYLYYEKKFVLPLSILSIFIFILCLMSSATNTHQAFIYFRF